MRRRLASATAALLGLALAAVPSAIAYADGTAQCTGFACIAIGTQGGGGSHGSGGAGGGSHGSGGSGGSHSSGGSGGSSSGSGGGGSHGSGGSSGSSSGGGNSQTAAFNALLAVQEHVNANRAKQLVTLRVAQAKYTSDMTAYSACSQAQVGTGGGNFGCKAPTMPTAPPLPALPKNATPAQKAAQRKAAAAVAAAVAVPVITPQQAAYIAVATKLKIPTVAPGFGPPPDINKWHMAAVGYPYWLWADGQTAAQSAAAVDGLQVTLKASVASMTYAMGDGQTLNCAGTGTPWTRAATPGAVSPTCGYRYATPSLPDGDYTVAATSHWDVAWTAGGQAGVIHLDRSSSIQVPVGELEAIITHG